MQSEHPVAYSSGYIFTVQKAMRKAQTAIII